MTALAVSWDEWRASYDQWGFREQQRFYDDVFRVCRVQRQFQTVDLGKFFMHFTGGRLGSHDQPIRVVELGGWDGEFAGRMLALFPQIKSWTNYEISTLAVDETVCDDSRYQPVALDDWYWTDRRQGDLFVASHVLEHLSLRDVRRVLDATEARWAYLQVPLDNHGRDWTGYHGSHILEIGWPDLIREMEARGWTLIDGLSRQGVGCFERPE